MLDDDARRALEEEAIALVSLSYSRHTPTKARRATPTNESSASTVASMSKPFATVNHVRPPPPSDVHKNDPRSSISMSLFVNGDMNLLHGSKSVDDFGSIHGSHPSVQNDVAITAGFHRGDGTDAVSPTHTDANISMQSLLVTLKKRQHDGTATHETTLPALKLPRFRDVFEPPRAAPEQLTHQNVPVAHSAPVMATPYPAYPPQQAVPQPVPHPPSSPEYVPEEQSSQPVPPELKCKYRTGKCTNIRALKSCGDYHNLCNYHRLRANANQRKLDRKKKVQKGPSSDHVPTSTPSVVAAAALAALPFPQNQHLEHSTQNIPPAPTSSYGAYLRPKLEPSPHP